MAFSRKYFSLVKTLLPVVTLVAIQLYQLFAHALMHGRFSGQCITSVINSGVRRGVVLCYQPVLRRVRTLLMTKTVAQMVAPAATEIARFVIPTRIVPAFLEEVV